MAGFLRGLDLSGTLQGAGGVGGLLAIKTATNGTHFYCHDGNGNVMALVDVDDGEVSALYEYDPFGNELRATGPMAEENPMRFSAQYADEVTGDLKYLFREYRPGMGRWLSLDLLGEFGGSNLYRHTANDPLLFIDILGSVPVEGSSSILPNNNERNSGYSFVSTFVGYLEPIQGVFDDGISTYKEFLYRFQKTC